LPDSYYAYFLPSQVCPPGAFGFQTVQGGVCIPFNAQVDVTPGAFGCPGGGVLTADGNTFCLIPQQ
jgi:hypothetical protein